MSDLHIRKEGHAGRITLTRPQALNALSYEMSLDIFAALGDWARDPDVALVIMDATGDRAFCAGGDLARIYHDAKDNKGAETVAFWRHEYELNDRIASYGKPVVAFMHGFVMGGGVGLAGHASHRIVGNTTQVAMPECAIGLIPDVGGSFILSRAPGAVGEYLGVTGARMNAADAIFAGFADHFLPEEDWEQAKSDLIANGDVASIAKAEKAPTGGDLTRNRDFIDRVFASGSVSAIADSLTAADGAFAEAAGKAFSRNSPLSMCTTLELIRRVRDLPGLRQAIALELRAASRCLLEGDFTEGIRAQIIDKDRSPKWKHSTLSDVSAAEVAHMLRPFEDAGQEFKETVK